MPTKPNIKSLFTIFLLLTGSLSVCAQAILSNNGAIISLKDGAIMSVHGDAYNRNGGEFHNSDTIYLFENWTNTAGNEAFSSTGEGIVILKGDEQRVQGNDITRFYDLRLEATGIKYGDLDVYVDGFLRLNDREFSLDINTVSVFNTDLNAVTTDGGFVSSLQNGGLLRYVQDTQPYFFPVGSSLGVSRYRPIELRLSANALNVFKVRHANTDATLEGFDRDLRQAEICLINPDYYHRIWQEQGTDSTQITYHYDAATDGVYDSLAHWQNVPQWEVTGGVTSGISPITGLDVLETDNYISDFSYPAFALTQVADTITLTINPDPSCDGESVTVTAPSSLLNYDFYLNDVLAQSGTNNTFTSSNFLDDDKITVIATDDNCTYFSNSVLVSIFMNTVLLDTNLLGICEDGDGTFAATPGFNNYDFYVDNALTQSGANSVFTSSTLMAGSTVFVIAMDDNCSYNSDTAQVFIFENSIELSVNDSTLCNGESFVFSATAGFLNYDFLVNGVSVQSTASSTFGANMLNTSDLITVIGTDANCDYESNTISVTIYSDEIELIANTLSDCPGETFTFTATSGFDNYDFYVNGNPGQSGTQNSWTTILNDADEIYVIGTDTATGCEYVSDTLTVTVFTNEVTLSANPQTACPGEIFTLSANGGFLNYDFYVNGSLAQSGTNATYTAALNDGDVVSVTATDANCTYESNAITLSWFQNTIELSVDMGTACDGDMLTFTATSGFTQYDFYVNGILVQSGSQNTLISTILENGDIVTVIGNDGNCDYESNPIQIDIQNGMMELQVNSLAVCEDEPFEFTATPGFAQYDFYVNGMLSNSSPTNTWTTLLDDGDQISVIGIISNCQFASDEIQLTVFPALQITALGDTTIIEGQTAPLSALGAATYTWTPSSSLSCNICESPLAQPTITTEYTVIGTSPDGCTARATVEVIVTPAAEAEFIIPNAFTPNGDGKNDVWNISFLQLFPENDVVVINRWGDEVFYAKPYQSDFDGRFKGKNLPKGTYYYVLRVDVNGSDRIFKGPLTIVR